MKICINYVGFARMLNSRIPVERDYKKKLHRSQKEIQVCTNYGITQANWILRVNRKPRDRLQNLIFMGLCIANGI